MNYFTFESPWDKVAPIFARIKNSTRFCAFSYDYKIWYCLVEENASDINDVHNSGLQTLGEVFQSLTLEYIEALDPKIMDDQPSISGHSDLLPWYVRPVHVKM